MKSVLVIADDFTGAAEVAGIGTRHGLPAQLLTEGLPRWRKGLTVIDADTRFLPPGEAARRTHALLSAASVAQFDLIYKKNDSVLRGRVREELEAAMAALGRSAAMLIPQNPARGRTIRGGEYRIGGVPLHATAFANDPEYPALSSQAIDLIGPPDRVPIMTVEPGEPLPREGIAICSAWEPDDLRQWAARLPTNMLPAGGGDFFEAVLERNGFDTTSRPVSGLARGSTLFVCGSASAYGREVIGRAESRRMPVCHMPDEVFETQDVSIREFDEWTREIRESLEQASRALIIISQSIDPKPETPKRLRHVLAEAVARVLDVHPVTNLLMEGGATASAVCKRMGWCNFQVTGELAIGVVQMQAVADNAAAQNIIVKPGSYRWPNSVW